jgi:mRNA interferase RelE/StbE
MEVRYLASAVKQLAKIDSLWRRRIVERVAAYAINPALHAASVKRLTGDGRLRMRVGDYRVVFTEDGLVLLVHHVGHRGDVYRRMT